MNNIQFKNTISGFNKRNSNWAIHEEEQLMKLYPDNSNETISQALGRTKASIDKKAGKLGLRKSVHYRTSVAKDNNKDKDYVWTESEINTLLSLYHQKTYKEIGKILKRSISSIAHKAKYLNLQKYNTQKVFSDKVEVS